MPPHVELHAHSIAAHLHQIYAGFLQLHRDGEIVLSQRVWPRPPRGTGAPHLRDAIDCHLTVTLDRQVRVRFDTHDSWEVDAGHLAECDVYFKRSYAPERLRALGAPAAKVHALGLNLAVYPDGVDPFGLRRSLALATGARRFLEAARAANVSRPFVFTPRVGGMSAAPDTARAARVLFLARTFEVDAASGRSADKIEERERINEDRARCIRLMRREFGERFYGGFVHTPHAVARYADCLAPDPKRCAKGNYIRLLRDYPVCVATTGIHGSIGWKFAEYVSFAKAIVSEPLNYGVPGDLRAGVHYLEFSTFEECAARVRELMDDGDARRAMMEANAVYYGRYLRPDRLVANALRVAMETDPDYAGSSGSPGSKSKRAALAS